MIKSNNNEAIITVDHSEVPGSICVQTKLGQKNIGYLTFNERMDRIDSFFVATKCRQKGIGRAMFQALVDALKKGGSVEELFVYPQSFNPEGKEYDNEETVNRDVLELIYEKLGFVLCEKSSGVIPNKYKYVISQESEKNDKGDN